MTESKIPQPSSNQFLSTADLHLPHNLSLALANGTHPTPPLLNGIRSNNPPCIIVASKEDALPLRHGVFEYDFSLEVRSLILEDDSRIACVEEFEDTQHGLVYLPIFELIFH
jgi:hypothetical protein